MQSGLVAQWDGIENAGWGFHDDATNRWTDLTGNAFDWNLTSNVSIWDATGLRALSCSRYLTHEGGFHDFMTSEIRLDHARDPWYQYLVCWGDTTNFRTLTRYGGNSPGFMCSSGNGYWKVIQYSTNTVTATYDTASPVVYTNGTEAAYSHNGTWGTQGGNCFIVADTQKSYFTIRLYEDVLTAEEIAWNAMIDRCRYEGKALDPAVSTSTRKVVNNKVMVVTSASVEDPATGDVSFTIDDVSQAVGSDIFVDLEGEHTYVYTATPKAGHAFARWEGDVPTLLGSESSLTSSVPLTVKAVFALPSTVVSARGYVQDGLVANWDAAENQCYGVRSDIATHGWRDLVGGCVLTTNVTAGGSVTTLETGIVLTNASLRVYDEGGPATAIGNVLGAATKTVEIAGCEEFRKLYYPWLWTINGDTDTTDYKRRIFLWYDTKSYTQGGLCVYNQVYNEALKFDTDVGTDFTHSLAFGTAASYTLYANGLSQGTAASSGASARTVAQVGIALRSGGYTATPSLISNTVYRAVRVYNRCLTSAEIARNYAFDRMRFHGATSNETGYAFIGGKTCFAVSAASNGGTGGGTVSFSCEGASHSEGETVWFDTPVEVTYRATPDDASTFAFWRGDTDELTQEQLASAELTLTADRPRQLKAVFLNSAVWIYLSLATPVLSNSLNHTVFAVTANRASVTLSSVVRLTDPSLDLTLPLISCDSASRTITDIGTVLRNNTTVNVLRIPDTVTSLAANACSGMTSLSMVYLPSALQSIGSYAFSGCGMLDEVSPLLPDSVTSVGEGAFCNCTNLTGKVEMHGVRTLEWWAFANTLVGEIDLDGAPITTFGGGNYSSVTNFHPLLPTTLTGTKPPTWNENYLSWEGKDFKLTLAVPTWTELGLNNFRYMPWTEVDMTGASIEKMGAWCFYGCTYMTNVTFSAAFKTFPNVLISFACGNLKWVRFRGDPPEAITTNPFNIHAGASYYLPKWNEKWEAYLAGDENRTVTEMTSGDCENFRAAHPGEPIPTQLLSIGGAGVAAVTVAKGISWWYPDAPPVYRELSLFDLLGYDGKHVVTNGAPLAITNQNAALLFDGTTYSYNTAKAHLAFRWLGADGDSAEIALPSTATAARAMRVERYRLHQLSSGEYPNSRAPTAWTIQGKLSDNAEWTEIDTVTMTAESTPCWAYLTNATYATTGTSQTTPVRQACSLTFEIPKAKWDRYVAFRFTPTNSYNREHGVDDDYPYGLMELEILGELTTVEPHIGGFFVSRNGWNDLDFTFDLDSIGDEDEQGREAKSSVAWVELAAAGDTNFTNVVASSAVSAVTAGTGRLVTVGGLAGRTTYEARLLVSNDLALVATQKLEVAVSTLEMPCELGALTVSTNAEGRLTASLEVKALYVASVTVDLSYRASLVAEVQNLGSTTVTAAGTVVLDSLTTGVTPTATSLVDAIVTGDGVSQTITSTPFGFWLADAATPTQISNTVTRATFAVSVAGVTNLTLTALLDFGDSPSFDFTKLIAKPDGSPLAFVSPGAVFNSNIDIEEMILPDTVTEIPHDAFYNCSRLAHVRLPAMLRAVNYSAFYGCVNLATVENLFPTSCVTIGYNAFYGCYLLPDFKLSPYMTDIRSSSFHHCRSITELDIPDSVTNIEGCAFEDTRSLRVVRPRFLPHQIRTAWPACFKEGVNANYAPYSCPPIGPLVLDNPEMVGIGQDAFRYCYGMTSVDMLGSSISYIGTLAFFANAIEWVRFPTNAVTLVKGSQEIFTSEVLREMIFPGDPPNFSGSGSVIKSAYYIIRYSRKNAAWQQLLYEHSTNGWLTAMTPSEKATFRQRYPNERFAPEYWINLRGVTGNRYLLPFRERHGMMVIFK